MKRWLQIDLQETENTERITQVKVKKLQRILELRETQAENKNMR